MVAILDCSVILDLSRLNCFLKIFNLRLGGPSSFFLCEARGKSSSFFPFACLPNFALPEKKGLIAGWTNVMLFYYIDTSVLLENIPLVKFIKLHPGPEWFIFHNLTREFIDDVILVIFLYYFVYIIKRTLHGVLKIWILFSRVKNNILLSRCARS